MPEGRTVTETRRDTLPEHDFAAHEHQELRHGIDRMHAVGALRGTKGELSVAVLDVLHWVEEVLTPHAQWEDRWLYPEIDQRAGTPWATKLMTYEHQQILDAAHALRAARTALRTGADLEMIETRARIFALEALIRAHMQREERFLIPLLDSDGTVGASPPRPPQRAPAGAA